jgi:hypothetical protein
LRARLTVRKVRGGFAVEPYSDLVAQKEEDVKEHLEFLDRLMGVRSPSRPQRGRGRRAKGLWPSKGF